MPQLQPRVKSKKSKKAFVGTLFDGCDDSDSDDEEETDELQRYLKMKKTGFAKTDKDVLGWWRKHQKQFPRLSRFALDILSVPAMFAECERVFSQCKLTITLQRHKVSIGLLEAIQCLKHWIGDDVEELWRMVREVAEDSGASGASDSPITVPE